MYWSVLVRGVFYGRMSWGKWDDVILVLILNATRGGGFVLH